MSKRYLKVVTPTGSKVHLIDLQAPKNQKWKECDVTWLQAVCGRNQVEPGRTYQYADGSSKSAEETAAEVDCAQCLKKFKSQTGREWSEP